MEFHGKSERYISSLGASLLPSFRVWLQTMEVWSISKAVPPCTHSQVLTHAHTHAGSISSNGDCSQKTDINPQSF